MASGKSLEPKVDIRTRATWVCTCGGDWQSHQRKDGKGPLKAFSDRSKHSPVFHAKPNRASRRAMRRKR